ncbi:chloroplast phosphoglycerate kinase 3 [Artemisia annua]|uniref:Phosphoglycerate kinase n=2 Tax=Anthemideae TaxID=102810 RepID=A0A2U1QP71_ARTAN|nr:chloroplast phosphoglycerate kinase 3 [Artemisia annua]
MAAASAAAGSLTSSSNKLPCRFFRSPRGLGFADSIASHDFHALSASHDLHARSASHDIHARSASHDIHAFSASHDLHARSASHDIHARSASHDIHAFSASHDIHAVSASRPQFLFRSISKPSSMSRRRVISAAAKKSVGDLSPAELKGKKVFVRADLNVPLDDAQNITDDTRIRAAVPTIKHLIQNGAKVILSSHLGRPKGVTPKYSLAPLVPRLTELIGIQVVKADDCIGPEVEKLVAALPDGGVLLLENVRFYKEEEKNDPAFAEKLASLADLYVNDAFGTAHRAHASTEGVTKFLKPSVAGFLLQKELDYLDGAVSNPKRPFAAIVGGSKVSSKIGVIESLLEKCDILLLGGGMIFTFYKAQGLSVGSSLVEEDKLDLATTLLAKAKAKGVSLLLPTDVVIADKFAPDANSKIVPSTAIPDGWMGLDIGPDSVKTFNDALETTKTVIWNGPMGVFEFDKFAVGTEAVAKKLAELSGKGVTTIIGGGDSVAAVEKVGVADVMSHISTGGGASLELLEGKILPGVDALDEAVAVVVLRSRL